MIANAAIADVAELADALDLGSSTARCEGSSPFVRIKSIISQRLSHSSPTWSPWRQQTQCKFG